MKKNNVNDDDLSYLYLAKKSVSYLSIFENCGDYNLYYLPNDVILKSPVSVDDLTFSLLYSTDKGIVSEVSIDPNTTMIDFYSVGTSKEKLFLASFDGYSSSWDVRFIRDNYKYPTNFNDALSFISTSRENGLDEAEGIIRIVDSCREVFEVNKRERLKK